MEHPRKKPRGAGLNLRSKRQRLLLFCFFFSRVTDRSPRIVRIDLCHRLDQVSRLRPEVLLVYRSVEVHNKRHHSGIAVLRGISDERESSCHFPVDDVALGAARSSRSLRCEQAEKIPMKWVCFLAVALGSSVLEHRTDRTLRLAFGRLPIQTILLAFIADELLCVLMHCVTIVQLVEVFILGVGPAPCSPESQPTHLLRYGGTKLLPPQPCCRSTIVRLRSSSAAPGMANCRR